VQSKIVKILIFALLYLATGALIASLFVWAPNERNDFPLLRLFIIFFATILLSKYFIYMSVSPWYDAYVQWRNKRRAAASLYRPLVSVIIPAWNEEVGLVRTVQTVLQSTYRNVEVVVINDGSTDGSDRLMREFLAEHERAPGAIAVRYYYQQNGGKGSALNHGIRRSRGELVVSIDADCALRPDTIANFVKYFEDPAVAAAVGNVKIGNTNHLLGTLQYLEFLFSFYFKKTDSLFNTIYIIGGAAGAFRRSIFEQVGYYSEENITEDIDLSVRIQKAGLRIVYAADAVVYTEGASTLAGLAAQRLRWKRGRFQTFWEHRRLFFSAEPQHNKLLSWLVLPLAIFGDTQLFFEVFFLVFLYIYSYLTNDFSSFISGIVVVSAMFAVQLFDDRTTKKTPGFFLLAPIGWLLFYITTLVEYRALIASIRGILKQQKLSWQKWERTGVGEAAAQQPKASYKSLS
jgi:poly-beta-1,6-N-acetyl-D-glucosamine synthase